MKKLAFLFVAFAAISFASCGNKTSQAETAADTDTVAVEEEIPTEKYDDIERIINEAEEAAFMTTEQTDKISEETTKV